MHDGRNAIERRSEMPKMYFPTCFKKFSLALLRQVNFLVTALPIIQIFKPNLMNTFLNKFLKTMRGKNGSSGIDE